MGSLLYDMHLWTIRDDSTKIHSADSSCFKYADRSDNNYYKSSSDKVCYADERNTSWVLNNKKPFKLKSGIREMENLLSEQMVVFSKWRSPILYQMILSSSILINITINKEGGIDKINIDKSLVGKVMETLISADFNSRHLVAINVESNVAVVDFRKPLSFHSKINDPISSFIGKISNLEVQATTLQKRSVRHVQLSKDSNFLLIWWQHSSNEVHPWSPSSPDEDNHNIYMYSLKDGCSQKLFSMYSGSNPLRFTFRGTEGEVLYLGQEVSSLISPLVRDQFETPVSKNILEYTLIGASNKKMKRKVNVISQVTCVGLIKELIIICFTNGNIQIFDLIRDQMEASTKVPFIPFIIEVHPDGAIFFYLKYKRGFFNVSIYTIWEGYLDISLWNGECTETSGYILDLGQYFNRTLTLEDMQWCPRDLIDISKDVFPFSNRVIIRFQGGPLVLLRIFGGCYNNTGSIQPIHLTLEYLKSKNYNSIIRLLRLLNWSSDGHSILISLNASFNAVLRSRRSDDIIEKLLSLFYNPRVSIPQTIAEDYSEQVRDLSRRYFHHLLRRGRTGKAFQLAVDIEDYDLFMDLYHVATKYNYSDIADAALIKAHSIYESSSILRNNHKIVKGNRVMSLIFNPNSMPHIQEQRQPNSFLQCIIIKKKMRETTKKFLIVLKLSILEQFKRSNLDYYFIIFHQYIDIYTTTCNMYYLIIVFTIHEFSLEVLSLQLTIFSMFNTFRYKEKILR
nr:WD repeat-containing and planar cell polarity effector protein fritz homolog [Lepeophtheirus salmonis]